MNHLLKLKLERAFDLTRDLATHLDEQALGLDLPNLPSNRIASQFWCIVGARESYIKAIVSGRWMGFSCSLDTPHVKRWVLAKLAETREQMSAIDFGGLSDQQAELAFALLEHEIQHHGQLIRYVYANKLSFPKSWNARYTV